MFQINKINFSFTVTIPYKFGSIKNVVELPPSWRWDDVYHSCFTMIQSDKNSRSQDHKWLTRSYISSWTGQNCFRFFLKISCGHHLIRKGQLWNSTNITFALKCLIYRHTPTVTPRSLSEAGLGTLWNAVHFARKIKSSARTVALMNENLNVIACNNSGLLQPL